MPANPKRIALITTELRPGGAERNLVALAVGLNRSRYLPHVYSLAPEPPDEQSQLVDALNAAKIPVSFVNVTRSWQFFAAVRRLRAMLMQQSPEVIQSFLFHANVVSAVAARRMGVPVVAGLRVAQRERWRQMVERRLADRFAAFVCVSQGVANVAANEAGLPRAKCHVIPNGLDPQRFANVTRADLIPLGVREGQRVILYIGRFDHQKGVDLLIDAAQQFLPQSPDAVLFLVGDGAEKAALVQRVQQGELNQRIRFAPWQADALSLIAAADLVVIPSRYEGMSNVLLEAAALGKPVIAADAEGVRDVLGPDVDVPVVAIEDANALASAVSHLLNQPELSQEMGRANRQRVWEKFPLQNTIDAYIALYDGLPRPS